LARENILYYTSPSYLYPALEGEKMSKSLLTHKELREQIDIFIEKLYQNKIDDLFVIERLQQAAINLDAPSAEWFSVDIYKIFNSSLLLEQLRIAYRNKVGITSIVKILEIIRNVFVLAPILLTWLALSQASAEYQNVIATNSELITQPFLLQWERRFDGQLSPLLTFSNVAIIDVGLLIIIIAATFIVHWYQNYHLEKQDRRAIQLTSEYDNLLWQLNSAYSLQSKTAQVNLNLTKQMKEVVVELRQRGDDFQNLITAEQDRLAQLAKINQQQMAEMQTIIVGFQAGATHLANFSQNIQISLANLENATKHLAVGTEQVFRIQKDLNNNFYALEGRIGSFELVTQEISKDLANNFADLNYAAHVELTQINRDTDALSKQTITLGTSIEELLKSQLALQDSIKDNEKSNSWVGQRLSDAIHDLSTTLATYQQSTTQMVEVISKLYGVKPSSHNNRTTWKFPW